MKIITLYNRQKRAVSPVIAVILLIGLAVAASAAIFLIVLPLLEPTSSLELNDAYVQYDDTWTKAVEDDHGYGLGTLIVSNVGTGDVELVSFKIYYSLLITGPWTEVSDATSMDDISTSNRYVLEPLTSFETIDIRFPLPDENDDLEIYYKMVVETSSGSIIDTTKESDVVNENDMRLDADRPSIGSVTLGTIRRTYTVSPSSVSDNSEIKNVLFEVLPSGGGNPVKSKTITESLWRWSWNTRNMTSTLGGPDGLPNGNYLMRITVNDYAGLSRSITTTASFSIDNDYTPPTINYVEGEAPEAEVGTTYEVTANVIDTGSGDSDVQEVFLLYRLENATVNTTVNMVEGFGNNWTASIPVDARALENEIDYYIDARDKDSNRKVNDKTILTSVDTQNPDITHIPVSSANDRQGIAFIAEVEDPGLVDTSNVILYVRKANDLDANATVAGEMLPSFWVQLIPSNFVKLDSITWEFTWNMPDAYYNVTIHGLDYYISATDVYGPNTALHGTSMIPHHIQVLDLNPPDFIGITSSIFPSSWTENTSYPITVQINDNDPTFGRDVSGDLISFNTGEVIIHFKTWNGDPGQAFSPANIISSVHISGNSSNGEITDWFGTIPRTAFVADINHRVDFYITSNDQSKSVQDQNSVIPTRWPYSGFYSIDVKETGQPNVIYSIGSSVLKNNNATVSLMINNTASGQDDVADATLTGMFLEIYSNDWNFANGAPNLTTVYFTRFNGNDYSYNDTVGNPHPWGGNGSWITFESGNEGLVTDDNGYNIMELTFTNSSGGSINMHNMILNITFTAKVGMNDVADQELGLIATPGVEPPSTIFSAYLYSGRYYIANWLVTPGYSYGSTGLGWDSDLEEPWASPSEYSRADIAAGMVFPYHGFGVTPGYGSYTTNTWKMAANNENGYRMNIDTLMGSVSNTYVWFYAVVEFSGSIPSPTYMYLGSDDEAICYINGQVAGQYGSPRSYGETQFQVSSLLKGNGEKNYILFGVHEVGGEYRGGLAFSQNFQVKIYTGPPPAPLGSPLMAKIFSPVPGKTFSPNPSVSNPNQIANSLITIYRKNFFVKTEESF